MYGRCRNCFKIEYFFFLSLALHTGTQAHMQHTDILTFQELSLSNGDILTYFKLENH